MHAYNVNQGTYDFYRECRGQSPSNLSTSASTNERISPSRKLSTLERADSELDEFDTQAVRFKPESLDNLVKLTKFNKRELKLMYRGFKQVSGYPSKWPTSVDLPH